MVGTAWTHIGTLQLLLSHVPTRRRKQSRPTSLVDRVLHHRLHGRNTYLAERTIRILSLLWLIGRNAARMHCQKPGAGVGARIETQLAFRFPLHERGNVQDLSELRSSIQVRRTDVGVELVDRGELGIAHHAMELGRLQNKSRVRRLLQQREQDHRQVELRDVVDLHVRIDAILAQRELAHAEARITDESVDALELGSEVTRDLVRLVQVLELDLDCMHA